MSEADAFKSYAKALAKEKTAYTLATSFEVYKTATYDGKAVLEWAKAIAATNTLVDIEQSYPNATSIDTNQFLFSINPRPASNRRIYYQGRSAALKSKIAALVERDKLLKIENAEMVKAAKLDESGAYTGPRISLTARISSFQSASNHWSLAANAAHSIAVMAANFPTISVDQGMVKAQIRSQLHSQRAQQSANAAITLQNGGAVDPRPFNPGTQPLDPHDPLGGTVPGDESPGAIAGKGIAYVLGFAGLVWVGYKAMGK